MQRSATRDRPSIGVIDSISAGFDAVLRHPGLLAIPLLLDLFLWVGPRLQASALYLQLQPYLQQMATDAGTADARLAVQELGNLLESFFARFNLFSWLSVGLVGVPSVNTGVDSSAPLVTGTQPWIAQVGDFNLYLVLLVVMTVIGLFISALFWVMLAQQLRGEPFRFSHWLNNSFQVWKSLLLLALVVGCAGLMSFLPISLAMLTVSLVSPELASLVPALALALLVWILFYCMFTLHGLALYRLPLTRAVRVSYKLVRANFLPALGLALAALAIYLGLGLIWNSIAMMSWLRSVAMIGNAIIGTGLIMASLVFYQNRTAIMFEQLHLPQPVSNL